MKTCINEQFILDEELDKIVGGEEEDDDSDDEASKSTNVVEQCGGTSNVNENCPFESVI